MAFEASCFIKHVIQGHLKKNRPSAWRHLSRPEFEKAATKQRRTSLRTFVLLLVVAARVVSSMRVLPGVLPMFCRSLLFAAAVATFLSMVGKEENALSHKCTYFHVVGTLHSI